MIAIGFVLVVVTWSLIQIIPRQFRTSWWSLTIEFWLMAGGVLFAMGIGKWLAEVTS